MFLHTIHPPCQYGVLSVRCGATSVTMRPRPANKGTLNGERWWVCQRHADFLDRLRSNIAEHKPLLDRLATEPAGSLDIEATVGQSRTSAGGSPVSDPETQP